MSTLTAHWASYVAPVWKSHWGDSLIVTTRTETQTLTGVVSTVTGDEADEEGFRIISHDAEILFLTSDVTVCIEAGTRILHTVGTKEMTYEVLADSGQPAWEYDDPQRTKMKVRVNRIKEADALS